MTELFGDPHRVSPGPPRRRAEAAGPTLARRSGSPVGDLARFDRRGAARPDVPEKP